MGRGRKVLFNSDRGTRSAFRCPRLRCTCTNTITAIAHVSSKVNKIDSAKTFLERAITGNTSLYGEHSAPVINDKLCLVKLLIQINRIDEASDLIRDIVASMSNVR